MDKRIVLTGILLQLCASLAWGQGFGDRRLITDNWYFELGDGKYWGAEYFDHSKWRKLDLPHDWSIEQEASPALSSCTGYLPGGIAWYRKDLDIPASAKDKKVYIYFEGVYNNSEVFINGKWIGKRPNGYISFMYDLTPFINFGGRNVLAVRVDHSSDADSRWYTGSGIYRDVYLVYANPIHIDKWGVSYTTALKKNSANLTIQTEIKNTTPKTSKVKITHEVYDQDNQKVASTSYNNEASPLDVTKTTCNVKIENPIRWSLDNPYLYTLHTTIKQDGKIVDQSETKAGIRSLTFDPDKGFALNGKYMKLKGVCIHHDAGCLGAAVPKEVWRYRLKQLKEIGCNAIRMSHNPQATCVYELCDELGILVDDEAFDEWEYPKKKWIKGWNIGEPGFQGSASYFREWSKKDLADMIRRDRNHPSIIMWSIGNEVDYPNDPYSHPILNEEGISQYHVKGYQKEQPRAERLGDIAKGLVEVVKKHDLSRPVTAALAGAVMSNETEYPDALDIVGYNYTEHRYEQDHKKYPKRVLYGSETRHDLDAWKAVRDNDFIFGQFIWTGFDYLGEAGAWPSRGFTTGMIDLAGNIKPNGYFRRALWSDTPVIYIGTYKNERTEDEPSASASATWNYYEPRETIRVVAYTNCDEAELLLNGAKVGNRKSYNDQNAIIHWDIPYAPGKLEVIGYKQGNPVARDMIRTSGLPHTIKASLNKNQRIKEKDCMLLSIWIEDKHGIPVVLADNQITCHIQGPAKLLGLENGSDDVTDNYRDNKQRCKNGKLLGYIQATDKGIVSLKLTSPLLQTFNIRFEVE